MLYVTYIAICYLDLLFNNMLFINNYISTFIMLIFNHVICHCEIYHLIFKSFNNLYTISNCYAYDYLVIIM